MKFELQLSLKALPEWKYNYLDYKKLKDEIYLLKDQGDLANTDNFVLFFREDLVKIETFYKEEKGPYSVNQYCNKSNSWALNLHKYCCSQFKKIEFDRLNISGIKKILKKADKFVGTNFLDELWKEATVYGFVSSELDEILLQDSRKLWRKVVASTATQDRVGHEQGAISHAPILYDSSEIKTVSKLDLGDFPKNNISRVWVTILQDGLGKNISVPVIVAKGLYEGPIVGITAALHGNELNGIPLIHRLFTEIDTNKLYGTLVAVPVANSPGYNLSQRGFSDGTDLNRVMPGRADGSSAQVWAYNLMNKIVRNFEYLLDLHTASRGRANSLYVRADLLNTITRKMALLQNPQIIVHNTSPDGSLRGSAMNLGIPSITVEIGDPSRFQKRFVKNALLGVTNFLSHLKMIPDEIFNAESDPTVCSRSYWIFASVGGGLFVIPEVNTWVKKGEVIAHVTDIFGCMVEKYFAPDDGIVIGKQFDPVCQTGTRILHLGIIGTHLPGRSDDGHL
ncbi:N-alpha-acetyl-L-2,4-diaminobutyric acid deacetylase [Smittium culicis]|uniref:N-alpha-acetyl-L-2,4-diaminobutyric acid deacetylase n=1 Tax=Smittium culicis TaxID=133412 RepID=A0A1R1Y7N2_9FUNG|nr:N-alpha-acetyl-L-2,4-diaminobutyric acid deacetylase [Smittium culicis]